MVESILASTPAPIPAAVPTANEPTHAVEEDVADLLEVYFELETPEERDALFDRISTSHTPLVDAFLRVMMAEDEDDYMRSAAAGELARRGDAEAITLIEADLDEPDELFFFEHAMEVLSELRGESFYDALSKIWHDPDRDADQRRAAMVGMEQIHAGRALTDFCAFVDGMHDVDALPDDQLEVAMAAFARHEHVEAVRHLEALRARILAASLDEDQRHELAGFVQEGIALLTRS